jgi:DNA mismatch repair protein MutL
MPHDAVDVNVHPTKAEVRFRDQSYMHELIRRTIGDALGRGPAPELQLEAPAGFRPVASTLPLPHAYPSTFPSRWTAGPVGPAQVGGAAKAGPSEKPPPDGTGRACADAYVGAAFSRPDSNGPAIAASPIRPMTALGQFRDTFIIAIDDEGIAIIDQHVAHERVLFERITERLSSGTLESQRMLVPMLVEMPASGRQALSAHAADLERLGFEIEAFGGESLRVTACPALLSREDCAAALRALAEDLEGLDRGAGVDAAIKRIAATTACHAAVKANYPLTHEKMAHILDELRRTAYSTICPHGRPVMLRITRREVEKNFQRV